LPWRAELGQQPDPYHVLVSEAMLQQTQVATVINYFNRFVRAFPTVEALAAADEQHVLRHWQGLGYYRRARHLHAAARQIANESGGCVPDCVDRLRRLPGVGRYTAGAIASIAYGKPEPAVDGNVKRVLARLAALRGPVDRPDIESAIWQLAGRLARGRRPGDVNQALMELGATICTPRVPQCSRCPLERWCRASAEGRADELPINGKRVWATKVRHDVVAVRRRGRHLFERRGDGGLWAGMWQMPTREGSGASRGPSCDALAGWLAERLGLTVGRCRSIAQFTHMTTHRRIAFHTWVADVQAGRLRRGAGVWRSLEDLGDLPISNAQRRAINLVQAANAPATR
jgi:A/G-specific adenine glycosylase